jgi:hypothetical protein
MNTLSASLITIGTCGGTCGGTRGGTRARRKVRAVDAKVSAYPVVVGCQRI